MTMKMMGKFFAAAVCGVFLGLFLTWFCQRYYPEYDFRYHYITNALPARLEYFGLIALATIGVILNAVCGLISSILAYLMYLRWTRMRRKTNRLI